MGRTRGSVGFNSHWITTQRNLTARLGVSRSTVGGRNGNKCGRPNCDPRLALLLSHKQLQTIGVYLTKLFGSNVRFRILKELGSFEPVVCVAEVYYPDKFYGTRVGVTRGVLK
ncbi:unnamed protein product [marine sediment metagenome]|uniref:Uncharacterized protein n=1 Tax=marine sediment metagenome TaxID=412755 RepID=X1RCZ4_9ZZZZ